MPLINNLFKQATFALLSPATLKVTVIFATKAYAGEGDLSSSNNNVAGRRHDPDIWRRITP